MTLRDDSIDTSTRAAQTAADDMGAAARGTESASGATGMLGHAAGTLGSAMLQRKIQRRALQRRAAAGAQSQDLVGAAERGVTGAGGPLPHGDTIQRAFGRHDVSHVEAHTGAQAGAAAESIGAEAYAMGSKVAFAGTPSLYVAAHEAAHVVQQGAGVHLSGGVGQEGDAYERHADAVAERVVSGGSAESLLDAMAPSAPAPTGGGAAVQRYAKHGATRVSDGHDLAVVDGGTHNRAFATNDRIEAGKTGLREGSQIELEAGPAVTAEELGLAHDAVSGAMREVKVKQKAGEMETRQREGAIDLSTKYKASAEKVMRKLATPTFWQKLRKETPDVDISEVDPERDILGNEDVKQKITATYTAIASNPKGRDFSPENVAKVAASKKVPTKIIYFLMNQMKDYHSQILTEYEGGGLTTPNDCGEVAKNFVRGEEIQAHTGGGEGYPYHFFSMVFKDGEDRISLENAVGGNHLEQIWKQGAYDANWHWEMRGTNRPEGEQGAENEETHGVGEAKTTPSQGFRDRQTSGRLELQDKIRGRR